MRPLRGSVAAAAMFVALVLAGCSGSSSSSAMSKADCTAKYKAAASTFNSTARQFALATSNGTPNAEFPTFAARYVTATQVFDDTIAAMNCGSSVNSRFAELIDANKALVPYIQQFADGQRPDPAQFNEASAKVATAVQSANDILGVTK